VNRLGVAVDDAMASHRHVAWLRGLNVGVANRLSMEDLSSVFEEAGAAQVKRLPTLVATGNS